MNNLKSSILVLLFLSLVNIGCVAEKKSALAKKDNFSSRSIASNSNQQELINKITDRILAIDSADKIESTLENITNDYYKNAKEKKYHAVLFSLAIFKSVPMFKSILWRFRFLSEQSDILSINALSALRTFHQKDYMYGPHVKAFFDYLTRPTTSTGHKMFSSIRDVQDFSMAVAKRLENLDHMLSEIYKNPASEIMFSFDRRLLVGGGDGTNADEISFFSKEEVRKLIIKPYILGLQAQLKRTIAITKVIDMYQLDDLVLISKELTKKTAINLIKGRVQRIANRFSLKSPKSAKGLSSEMVFNIFDKSDFLISMSSKSEGQKIMNEAKSLYQEAAKLHLQYYVCSINYPIYLKGNLSYDSSDCNEFDNSLVNDETHVNSSFAKEFLFNPNSQLMDFKRHYRMLNERVKLFSSKGTYSMVSSVTGQVIEININNIFKFKKDIKAFFPISYDNKGAGKISGGFWNWNYDWGRPTRWKTGIYSSMFPQVTGDGSGRGVDSMHNLSRNLSLTDALIPFSKALSMP